MRPRPAKPEAPTPDRACFLVVDGDARTKSGLRERLAPYGEATCVVGAAEALRAKSPSGEWAAVFVDASLADGDAFELVEALRARGERTPAVVVMGGVEESVVNRAFEAGVGVVARPMTEGHVKAFVERARPGAAIEDAVAAWGERFGLTPAERVVLRGAIDGLGNVAMAKRRGVSVFTVKSQVGHLLEKTGESSIAGLVQRVLRGMIGGRGGGRA